MKVRAGFVSNSSSSSFIVRGTATTQEIASAMLEIIFKHWEDFGYIPEQIHLRAKNWLDKNIGFNDPVLIPWTTNYETFIWRTDSGICVETCNNIEWYDLWDDYVIDYKDPDYVMPSDQEEKYLDLGDIHGPRVTSKEWYDAWREKHRKQTELIQKQRENDNK